MRLCAAWLVVAAGVVLLGPGEAQAGMPSPVLSDWAALRLEAISFFVLAVLVCTALVRWLWNLLAKDFSQLPRLTYGKTLAAVVLWGLMLVVILTMIAGARELMTPGAWQKQGLLYKVTPNESAVPEPQPFDQRKGQLERLRMALWNYAAIHQGHLPANDAPAVASHLWNVPDGAGMRYGYIAGLKVGDSSDIVAYEPELFGVQRMVLYANGEIAIVSTPALREELQKEKRP